MGETDSLPGCGVWFHYHFDYEGIWGACCSKVTIPVMNEVRKMLEKSLLMMRRWYTALSVCRNKHWKRTAYMEKLLKDTPDSRAPVATLAVKCKRSRHVNFGRWKIKHAYIVLPRHQVSDRYASISNFATLSTIDTEDAPFLPRYFGTISQNDRKTSWTQRLRTL